MSNNQIKILEIIKLLTLKGSFLTPDQTKFLSDKTNNLLFDCEKAKLNEETLNKEIDNLYSLIKNYCLNTDNLNIFQENENSCVLPVLTSTVDVKQLPASQDEKEKNDFVNKILNFYSFDEKFNRGEAEKVLLSKTIGELNKILDCLDEFSEKKLNTEIKQKLFLRYRHSKRKPGSKVGPIDPNAVKSLDSGKRGTKKIKNAQGKENSPEFIKEQNSRIESRSKRINKIL